MCVQVFDCTYGASGGVLDEIGDDDNPIVCWQDTSHVVLSSVAFVAFLVYYPIAVLSIPIFQNRSKGRDLFVVQPLSTLMPRARPDHSLSELLSDPFWPVENVAGAAGCVFLQRNDQRTTAAFFLLSFFLPCVAANLLLPDCQRSVCVFAALPCRIAALATPDAAEPEVGRFAPFVSSLTHARSFGTMWSVKVARTGSYCTSVIGAMAAIATASADDETFSLSARTQTTSEQLTGTCLL